MISRVYKDPDMAKTIGQSQAMVVLMHTERRNTKIAWRNHGILG